MSSAPDKPLVMEKPVYGGDCLTHLDGKAIFVPLTLPGEAISARITEQKRSFARAEADRILTPSPNRIPPACPHFGTCGGCHYQHADYPTQLALKEQILRETLSRADVPYSGVIERLFSEPWAYRNRIRLAVSGAAPEACQLGYRSRHSHQIVPIRECPITAPILLQTALAVGEFLANHPSPIPILEIELFTNQKETELLLTLFTEVMPNEVTPSGNSSSQTWIESLQAALPIPSAGLRLQLQDGSLNPPILAATGSDSITYTAAGFPYRVDHGAFFQVNHRLIDGFAALVIANRTGTLAWDLYAGVGLFARRLTDNFAQVLAVESAPASFPGLQRNLAGTTGRPISSTTLGFLRRNREEREPRPDLIVLDPPRAGLGEEVTSLLNAIHAPEMVYVSCDPATLARDLRALTRERFRIERITLADMFPQTFHMETVVELRRS